MKGEEERQSDTLRTKHSCFLLWHKKAKCFVQEAPDLDEDLPLELVWRGQAISCDIHRLGQQHVSEHLLEVSGHIPLLHNTAVVLDGEDDGIAAGGPQIRTSQEFSPYLRLGADKETHYNDVTAAVSSHCFFISVSVSLSSRSHHAKPSPPTAIKRKRSGLHS